MSLTPYGLKLVSVFVLIFFAGLPTIVEFAGTFFKTTVLAPILAHSPTVIGPRICALEPTITLSNRVGCLLLLRWLSEFSEGDIPPKVTP